MAKLTIPEIRELIYELTAESQQLAKRQAQIAKQIAKLAKETTRRSPTRKAPPKRTRITFAIREAIRDMVQSNPDMPYRDIAAYFDVDGGRVSEIVAGMRGK